MAMVERNDEKEQLSKLLFSEAYLLPCLFMIYRQLGL